MAGATRSARPVWQSPDCPGAARDGVPSVDVVIVTWNSAAEIGPCLESIFDSGDIDPRVVIVDNASKDATLDMVRDWGARVTVCALDANVGFPRACNLGARLGRSEYVLMLNPDTVVERQAIAHCIEPLRLDASVGLVGPRIVYPTGELQWECARRDLSLWSILCQALMLNSLFPRVSWLSLGRLPSWMYGASRAVPCILGAFMLCRRAEWDCLRGFDEQTFMYYEDMDLCARMRERGLKVWYEASALVVHDSGASSRRSDRNLDTLMGETRWRFFREHRSRASARLVLGLVVLQVLVRLGAVAILSLVATGQTRKRSLSRQWSTTSSILRWVASRKKSVATAGTSEGTGDSRA